MNGTARLCLVFTNVFSINLMLNLIVSVEILLVIKTNICVKYNDTLAVTS